MEIKWTPWRGQFVKGELPADDRCVLCVKHQESDDAPNLVLYRGATCYVLMNLYPYNPGHVMIVPYDHTNDLINLPSATSAEMLHLGQKSVGVLTQLMKPHGFNLGMNLGRTAGAGIDEHLHLHVVPRWNGDTNFMPLIGGVKLIPEAIDETYTAMKPLFDQI